MALEYLSNDEAKAVMQWLQESAEQSREHDPDVGIFANENMASAFEHLISYVEEETGSAAP